MSPDCLLIVEMTAQVLESKAVERVVIADGGDHAAHQALEVDVGLGVISPAMTTRPVASRFPRRRGCRILLQAGVQNGVRDWSAILSGWPSVTDSEVNKKRSLNVNSSIAGNSIWQPAARTGTCWITGARARRILPHRTHSRTRHTCTVRRTLGIASHHVNCRGRAGAKTCSEWAYRKLKGDSHEVKRHCGAAYVRHLQCAEARTRGIASD